MSESLNPKPAQPAGLTTPRSNSMGAYFSSLRMYPRQAWKAMIACGMAMMLGPAGILSATTTFFTGPISEEFGWKESATLTLFSLPLIIVPFVLPFGGRWVDRWGARAIAIPATALYALTTAMTALVGASQLALGALLVISMGFGYIGCVIVVFKVMLLWFPYHRGMAFASVGVMASLAGSVFSPLSEWLISTAGWRATFVLLGVAILVLALPAQVFLLSERNPVRQSPGDLEQAGRPETPPAPAELPGVPLRKAIRTRAWILMALILAIAGGAVTSVTQNAVSLLGERGYSSEIVSLTLSAASIASIVGLLVAGLIFDRASSPRVLVLFVACALIALVIVASVYGSVPVLFLAMSLLGVVRGAESTIGPYLISRYFGQRSFAQLQGLTLGFCILVMGLIPIAVQTMAEQSSSYSGPLLILIIACAVVLVLAFFLPRYRYPALDTEPAVPAPRTAAPADRVAGS